MSSKSAAPAGLKRATMRNAERTAHPSNLRVTTISKGGDQEPLVAYSQTLYLSASQKRLCRRFLRATVAAGSHFPNGQPAHANACATKNPEPPPRPGPGWVEAPMW